VDHDLDLLLERSNGAAEYAELVAVLGKVRADNAIRRGALECVFPRVYTRPWDADDRDVRDRAAALSVGGDAAICGVSALRRWLLPAPPDDRIHVIVTRTSRPRSRHPDLVVHRTKLPTQSVSLAGVPTQSRALAVAWAWTALPGSERRAPAIEAVRRGDLAAHELRRAAGQAIRMKGRRDLLDLADLLAAGCESELEIWGYLSVFDVPDLRSARRQLRLRVGSSVYRADLAYEAQRLAVELDGRRYHASPEQWERDIKRDLALATIGWQTIRLSHQRLTRDPEGCRRDVRRVLAARGRWTLARQQRDTPRN
jgi:very-short-patch-repair endonuclease